MLFSPIAAVLHLVVSAVALIATAYVVPGFQVKDFPHALLAAFVIGVANILIRPLLLILTLPINILTLGLFTFVVDAVILKLCAAILKGFNIDGWASALLGALILAFVGGILHWIVV